MTVKSVHRWPADQASIEEDLAGYGDDAEELRDQITENHRNAWLVVVEHSGPADDIDFSLFACPTSTDSSQDRSDWQAAWLEACLTDSLTESTVGFYMHYLAPGSVLYYGREELKLPSETSMPLDLKEQMPYESPD